MLAKLVESSLLALIEWPIGVGQLRSKCQVLWLSSTKAEGADLCGQKEAIG